MATSSRLHIRKKLEEKASGIKEIRITDKRGTEVDNGVKNWVWQNVKEAN